ncbi:DUF1080 domain-containing protein [bacterium]|nr:DUF1080 domain-containing protein [bacterium]
MKKMFAVVLVSGFLMVCAAGVYGAPHPMEPEPRVVSALEGQIPGDAVVLFDGKNLSEWTYMDGKPAGWTVENGAMIVKGGTIKTKREFGDVQLHIEFATPAPAKGEGQDRGNSGVYLNGVYEVQVLDSYGSKTYVNGQCGAVYENFPPLVNASRPAGQWQTYDIIFRAPRYSQDGNITQKANITVLHNGVLIQDHVYTSYTLGGVEENDRAKGPIILQDHNHPVKYRNIWIRELK